MALPCDIWSQRFLRFRPAGDCDSRFQLTRNVLSHLTQNFKHDGSPVALSHVPESSDWPGGNGTEAASKWRSAAAAGGCAAAAIQHAARASGQTTCLPWPGRAGTTDLRIPPKMPEAGLGGARLGSEPSFCGVDAAGFADDPSAARPEMSDAEVEGLLDQRLWFKGRRLPARRAAGRSIRICCCHGMCFCTCRGSCQKCLPPCPSRLVNVQSLAVGECRSFGSVHSAKCR